MYSILVLQAGVSPKYILDEMELYEIETLMDNLWRRNKESWEQTRTVSYITAQSQSTKKLDPLKIMPLPWDKKNEEKHIDTEEEKEDIWKEMKEWEKKMNKENKSSINGQ